MLAKKLDLNVTMMPRRIEGTNFFAFDVKIQHEGQKGSYGGVNTCPVKAFQTAWDYLTNCEAGKEFLKKKGWI